MRALVTLVLGTLLNLTAVTSVIVLGWLMRLMRARALAVAGQAFDHPSWLRGDGVLGGLRANVREGIAAAAALFVATFPFTILWLTSWWAGWENSFNKGYEQAFVGPIVGLTGVAVFALVMLHLPMALAHQATEARAWSLFELRRVRSVVRHTGYGYVIWVLASGIAALPIFASRGVPVFAEGIHPGLADMGPDQIALVRFGIDIATAAYSLIALIILKRWSAGIYARAAGRAAAGSDAALWHGAVIGASDAKRPFQVTRLLRNVITLALWVAFAFVIYLGQFLNHDWWAWMTHPFVFLPWSP
ncbi:DUF4013 domain-containing protein [Aliiroseovarius subalbicans]|uniref:DUF4013 domain-containing protein n=1 Tax=Aliiroseovarius subalbicans TaxID=2925840 RepID=UPI001F591327|nr:DUF4013 domain-containing protein [Aliiroseovarius subalbicans]MCI2398784.1 DUF4013 domain-containing protein [Aliiroseovarius subalbicans]